MKKFILAALLLSSSLYADDQVNPITTDTPKKSDQKQMIENELTLLNALIDATTQNLANQKALRDQIKEYQTLQAQYMVNPDNTDLLFRTAKSADTILTSIQSANLTQTFSPEFIKEITLFSQVSKKRGIPKSR